MGPLPTNTLMLIGNLSTNDDVDPEMLLWCEETLTPGWEFGWFERSAFSVKVAGKDGKEDEDIKVKIRTFCVRLVNDSDTVAFRLRWNGCST